MPEYPITISVSIAKAYKYKSLVFTYHDYHGPEILRHKDHEIAKRRISLRQWGEFYQWLRLDQPDREKFRIN